MKNLSISAVVFVLTALAGCGGGGSGSLPPQSAPKGTPSNVRPATLTSADAAAASSATGFQSHFFARTNASARSPKVTITYPGQLTYQGGAQLVTTVQHPVYIDCADGSCWGGAQTPAQFINNFANSAMIHQVDEYIGAFSDGRYPLGAVVSITDPVYDPVLHTNDMLRYVHAAAATLAMNNVCSPCTGYGHEYHVFLPQGIDICFDDGACYSPDNPAAFVFCAYHASVDFPDIGHVVFSVEPYQGVAGCEFPFSTPNGTVIDSTASTISHEIFESITDPDQVPGSWRNISTGEEIADECAPFIALVHLGAQDYDVQQEYSNNYKGCLSP